MTKIAWGASAKVAPKEGADEDGGAKKKLSTVKIVVIVVVVLVLVLVGAFVALWLANVLEQWASGLKSPFASSSSSASTSAHVQLSMPPLEPPVTDATPAGLKARRRRRQLDPSSRRSLGHGTLCHDANDGPNCKTEMDMINERLFTDGAGGTDFMYRIESVDSRIQSLKTRASGSALRCLDEATQEWSPTVPGAAFPMHFSCEESMTGQSNTDLKVYFGVKDNTSYVAEIQQSTTGMNGAVLGRINADSTDVHIWQIISDVSDATLSSWYEIKASRDGVGVNTDLQLSFAANADPTCCNDAGTYTAPHTSTCCHTGIGCGIRLRANGGYTYGTGTFTDRNCSNNAITTTCLDSSDLSTVTAVEEASAAACDSSASWDVAELFWSVAETFAPDAASLVNNFGGLPAYGLTDFTTSANSDAGPPPVPRPPPSPAPPPVPLPPAAACNDICSCRENEQGACVACCQQQKSTCLAPLGSGDWRAALQCNSDCSDCYVTCGY